jgi:putative addiction module component (TIGR02574 family)
MSDPVVELAAKGTALAPDDRARLIDLLLASLDDEPRALVEAAWADEIERRLDAYDRGEVHAIDGEQVLEEARRIAR